MVAVSSMFRLKITRMTHYKNNKNACEQAGAREKELLLGIYMLIL